MAEPTDGEPVDAETAQAAGAAWAADAADRETVDRAEAGDEVEQADPDETQDTRRPRRNPLLIPLITGVAEAELDKQRIEELIAEVLARHEAELQKAEQQERVRFVTDVLRDQNVRPRRLVYRPDQSAPPPLRFAEITAADVEEGFDQLRRLGRTAL